MLSWETAALESDIIVLTCDAQDELEYVWGYICEYYVEHKYLPEQDVIRFVELANEQDVICSKEEVEPILIHLIRQLEGIK